MAAARASSTDARVVATEAHVGVCFEALCRALGRVADIPIRRPAVVDERVSTPLFVTLKKRTRDGEYDLRGCIGSLSPVAHSRLGEYACKSAFEDRRFDPVAASELPLLSVGVSFLVQYEDAASPLDWVVGVHGIILEFTAGGRPFSATYLPEVSPEQGWTQRQAVESLARKAGYKTAPIPPEVWASMRVTRYQSSKCESSWDAWHSQGA